MQISARETLPGAQGPFSISLSVRYACAAVESHLDLYVSDKHKFIIGKHI